MSSKFRCCVTVFGFFWHWPLPWPCGLICKLPELPWSTFLEKNFPSSFVAAWLFRSLITIIKLLLSSLRVLASSLRLSLRDWSSWFHYGKQHVPWEERTFLKVPKVNTTRFGLNSWRYQAPKIWRSLPNVARASVGGRKRRKLKALIPRVVVFVNDSSSAERRIDFAVFFIVLWSYGRKICLIMCHGNSENSYGCLYLLRICFIYGKWVYRGVESLCKLKNANKVPFYIPTNGCKSKYCPS